MNKVYVIGVGATQAHVEAAERSGLIPAGAEVVHVNSVNDIPKAEPDRGIVIVDDLKRLEDAEPFIITAIPQIEMPFMPKQPKGHIRPYKFHQ